jgi:hypothetical protein
VSQEFRRSFQSKCPGLLQSSEGSFRSLSLLAGNPRASLTVGKRSLPRNMDLSKVLLECSSDTAVVSHIVSKEETTIPFLTYIQKLQTVASAIFLFIGSKSLMSRQHSIGKELCSASSKEEYQAFYGYL